MPRHAISGHPRASLSPTKRVQPITWKLEDAKVRFSEVVRRGRTEGPQRITVRGKDAVVVIAVETLAKPRQNLVAFLQGLGIGDRDLTGEHDTGRHIIL